ncbi:hypothetical protein IAD21_05123 [Abditibacteriota bacterium]|nr:hypothetical protein IAD21_05123 [Abditibacteriota bacterium]
MAGFSLQTLEGELIGFLLLAGKESREEGANPRDCVFMSVPSKGELIEHELNLFLTEFKATEFRCTLSNNDETWKAIIPINEAVQVQLNCPNSKEQSGTLWVIDSNSYSISGRCQLL